MKSQSARVCWLDSQSCKSMFISSASIAMFEDTDRGWFFLGVCFECFIIGVASTIFIIVQWLRGRPSWTPLLVRCFGHFYLPVTLEGIADLLGPSKTADEGSDPKILGKRLQGDVVVALLGCFVASQARHTTQRRSGFGANTTTWTLSARQNRTRSAS